jgi:hypothetical protein
MSPSTQKDTRSAIQTGNPRSARENDVTPRPNAKTNRPTRPDPADGEIVFAPLDEHPADDGSPDLPVRATKAASSDDAVVDNTDVISIVTAEENYFSFDSLRPFPHLLRHPLRAGYWIFEVAFGIVSLFALLAFLAAIPVVNFLALGYMLEAEGRVARTGKLRYALPLLPLAPKLGGIAFGTWIWCWLVQLVADAASDAALIAPGSRVAAGWQIGLTVVAIGVAIHVILAIARGGRLGLFFWPTPLNGIWLLRRLMRGDYSESAGKAVETFVAALRLRHHFWLGLRGFAGAFAWLFLPTALFGTLRDTSKPGQIVLTVLGGVVLVCVLSWVPFLQARFAAEQRWSAIFELRPIRALYRRTPIAFLLSVVVMYALALPLYLFTLFETPQDMRWLLTPIFVASIYPARIFVGWAYSWSQRKTRKSYLFLRAIGNIALWPLLGFYVFVLFFTPAVGAAGRAVLFQHHAVLLPWPF